MSFWKTGTVNDVNPILYLIGGIIVVVGLLASALVAYRRRSMLTRRDKPPEGRHGLELTEEEAEEQTGEQAVEAPEAPAELPETPELTATAIETPESVPSRMQRLRARLARSGGLGGRLLSILSRGDLSAADWEELEDTLLMADVGLEATSEIMESLKTKTKVEGTRDPERVRAILREELLALVDPGMDRSLSLDHDESNPATILVVGVNGTGKTTTVGKLARVLVAEGKRVVLGAADTFRAAAADQLTTWGERVGVDVVRSDREGADPASVAFDAVDAGRRNGADVVVVDTAGRLQNKSGLMDELGKIKRVVLGAADTFRAAAADQLTTWGERVGVDVVRSDREGADPASVAFDAVDAGRRNGADVVVVDTAGRLQNKSGLMDELGKIKRVMERNAPVGEVLLVLDATTGQNGMRQAQVFGEVTGITGIVLTKLDGTAKGGIVVSVQRELEVPVKLVGLGEGADDLAPFDPEGFVDALLQEKPA